MTTQIQTVRATVTVSVSIDANGSLAEGAATVLSRVECVERVEEPSVCGLSPGLNDTTVDCRARLVVAVGERGEDLALLRRALQSAVCVHAVDSLEPVGPPSEDATSDAAPAASRDDPPPGQPRLEGSAPFSARPSAR